MFSSTPTSSSPGAAWPSEHPSGSASLVVLLAELTLLDAMTSEPAVTECERNLQAKLPEGLAEHARIAFFVVPDPELEQVAAHVGKAHPKDLPLLVATLCEGHPLLTTFNMRDYEPGDAAVEVLRPGALVRRVRSLLAQLPSKT